LVAGFDALRDYLSAHVLTCLIPAFFIAGAIAALLQKETVLKYFGANSNKLVCYSVAATSGTILAVCSCTILPMFAGISKRGAGIGPATAFLFAGPAINLLAIVLTARVLGLDLGIARAVAAVSMAILIGLTMAAIFERGQKKEEPAIVCPKMEKNGEIERPGYITIVFIGLLVGILLVAASSLIPLVPKVLVTFVLMIAAIFVLMKYFSKEERAEFLGETWFLSKRIFPLLLIGTFVSGMVSYFLPYTLVTAVFGNNSFTACFVASVIGVLFYMPTLLEVPIVGTLFGYSAGIMAPGPALSLLLAGPSLSLPSIIVLLQIMGGSRAGVYIGLVIILSTFAGMIFGSIA
jgi:uncharacterized protein